jgi:four helix bundle protein
MNPNKEPLMHWDVYEVALETVRALRPVVEALARKNPRLAEQIKAAAGGIPSQLREGRRRVGKDRLHLWRIAAGSADEVIAHLDTATAWGDLDPATARTARGLLDRELAMLYRMTRTR